MISEEPHNLPIDLLQSFADHYRNYIIPRNGIRVPTGHWIYSELLNRYISITTLWTGPDAIKAYLSRFSEHDMLYIKSHAA